MLRRLCLLVGSIVVACPAASARADDGPTADAAAVKAPGPNSPDEPLAPRFSVAKAAEFLDAASLVWTRERKCGTCHTNYAYMMARPALKEIAGPAAAQEIRKFFESRAANWDSDKPRWDAEVVATAVTLAFNDAETTGKLHPLTRSALERMWTVQQDSGAWNWLKCNPAWYPMESDDYYGAVFAALGVSVAPDGYAETPAAKAGLEKLRGYLRANPAPNLHHKTILLWASLKLPDVMAAGEREATMKELLALQRPDGGWSLPSLADWKRRDGSPNDHASAPSDGYATGLVVYVLRQAGVAADHAAIQRGVAWLKTHQRESGRWFTRSVNNDNHHFIANAGSAYAVMALAACGELKSE